MSDSKNQTIEFVLEPLTHEPALQEALLEIREYVLSHPVACTETIHGGAHVRLSLYHIDHENDVVIGLSAGKDHVKVYYHYFDPAPSLQALKLVGKGKHSRHVQVKALTEYVWTDIHALFENTLRNRNNHER